MKKILKGMAEAAKKTAKKTDKKNVIDSSAYRI